MPTYGWGMQSKAAMRFGVGIYDLLTADRNRGIADPKRAIPNAYGLSRNDTLDLFPGLITDGLSGSVVFNDGQMQNPPRLVLAFVQSAARAGATVANYVEATGLVKQGDAIAGVLARDRLTDADFPIKAKMVLNAAGPYAEGLLEQALSQKPGGQMSYSRDACFVVKRRLFDHDIALAAQAQTHDPDALVSRGNRHLFVASWRDYTLIGTWHVVWKKDPAAITVEDAELEAFLAEAKEGFPGLDVDLDDVGIWNCGLVPFGENDEGATHLRYGHRSSLIDHAKDRRDRQPPDPDRRAFHHRPVRSRAGGRHRRPEARPSSTSKTAATPLAGGDFERFDDELARTQKAHGDRLSEKRAALAAASLRHRPRRCARRIAAEQA